MSGQRRAGDTNRDLTAYNAQLSLTARLSALVAGAVLLLAFPAWSVFDLLVLPARATEFITVRGVFEVLIGLALWALWRGRAGRRPESMAFCVLALPQLAIAWMIPRSAPQLTAYLLGFSLVVFGSAVVVVWRWQLTMWLTLLTLTATAVAVATGPARLSTASVTTIGYYLGTAGVVATVGQYYRYRAGAVQFSTEMALKKERSRNEALVAELRKLSGEDPLTGIGNRRAWETWAQQAWSDAAASGRPLSVVPCDFDRFKDINDVHGHAVGDKVLCAGAEILCRVARSTDLVARLGGDEFVVLCPDTDLSGATELAHRLAIATRTATWPHRGSMTLSFGVAELAADDAMPESLFSRADWALYQAKVSRDTVVSAAV